MTKSLTLEDYKKLVGELRNACTSIQDDACDKTPQEWADYLLDLKAGGVDVAAGDAFAFGRKSGEHFLAKFVLMQIDKLEKEGEPAPCAAKNGFT